MVTQRFIPFLNQHVVNDLLGISRGVVLYLSYPLALKREMHSLKVASTSPVVTGVCVLGMKLYMCAFIYHIISYLCKCSSICIYSVFYGYNQSKTMALIRQSLICGGMSGIFPTPT